MWRLVKWEKDFIANFYYSCWLKDTTTINAFTPVPRRMLNYLSDPFPRTSAALLMSVTTEVNLKPDCVWYLKSHYLRCYLFYSFILIQSSDNGQASFRSYSPMFNVSTPLLFGCFSAKSSFIHSIYKQTKSRNTTCILVVFSFIKVKNSSVKIYYIKMQIVL